MEQKFMTDKQFKSSLVVIVVNAFLVKLQETERFFDFMGMDEAIKMFS